MKRLNITIPDDLAQKITIFPNKSRFIAEAIKDRLRRMEKEKLDKLLAEGYRRTRQEDKEIDKEWEGATLEGWR